MNIAWYDTIIVFAIRQNVQHDEIQRRSLINTPHLRPRTDNRFPLHDLGFSRKICAAFPILSTVSSSYCRDLHHLTHVCLLGLICILLWYGDPAQPLATVRGELDYPQLCSTVK